MDSIAIHRSAAVDVVNVQKEVTGDETQVQHYAAVKIDAESSRPIPFVLSFSHLTYSVKIRPKLSFRSILRPSALAAGDFISPPTKTLLDDISGEARDGEIMAVLGASGAGKSTLIDALANRIAKESLGGSVALNGERLESRLLKAISAYVMQDDLLYPMLTVEETLMFAAELRLPRNIPNSKKKARVNRLIDQLGLRNAANTVIGNEGHRGVSGGERRRVSIGTDIVHDPILLFLDEPTSGLDSTSAFMVVQVLQRIAQSGSVVIMSVHQPSWRILGLLDRLIFLSRGQTVFCGPPSNLPPFFSAFGHPIPDNENWSEFALDLIRELETSPAGTKSLVEFSREWINSTVPVEISSLNVSVETVSRFANPIWKEIAVLSRRSMTNSRRMPEQFGVRLGCVVVTGFILATMFWHLDHSRYGINERLGFFAFAVATIFYTCSDALPGFLDERYIFMRETAYNTYRRTSYVLSHTITSIPGLIFLSAVFAAITFPAVGLAGGCSGFLFYFWMILLAFFTGNAFVSFLSGVIPNVMIGYTVVVATLAYFLLMSGFFINRNRIPNYWIWFHYISLIKYPYEGVMRNEFEDAGRCFVRGIQMFDDTMLEAVPEATKERLLEAMGGVLGISLTPTTCVTSGVDVLAQGAVTELSKWSCLLITLAWGLFFRILFYLALLIGSNNKRR